MRAFLLMAVAVPALVSAQTDSTVSVTWGGFLDAYYAYHFNLRSPGDAPLFTQPVRHNEFNINLAFIEAKLSSDRVRGRVALQVGTSVQSNYAGEPTNGGNSGPLLARQIQEAIAGYRIGDNLWLDGGIFLSHIGAEGWISRDNWTYTRSLIAEYSPYYETGVKVSWSPGSKLTATAALLNGWQNISETNANKALGVRLDYAALPTLMLSYSNFVGNEAPENESRLRVLHDFIAKWTASERIGLLASVDLGSQANTIDGTDNASWYGLTVIGRLQVSPMVALTGRYERYADPDGVFLSTTAGPGLELDGASLNLDFTPASRVLWRTELRGFWADRDAFPHHDGQTRRTSPFLVSSLALTF